MEEDKGKWLSTRTKRTRPQPYVKKEKGKVKGKSSEDLKCSATSSSKKTYDEGTVSAKPGPNRGDPSEEISSSSTTCSSTTSLEIKDTPGKKSKDTSDDKSSTKESVIKRPPITQTLNRAERYCCPDCVKWYSDSSLYESRQVHITRVGRHRIPRPNTPPGLWDISFPDSD